MIRAKFAFYYPGAPSHQLPPCASYLVVESDDPDMIEGSNVSAEQLIEAGAEIPETPMYSEWIQSGSPVYGGEKTI